jgi:hypothetical protein
MNRCSGLACHDVNECSNVGRIDFHFLCDPFA